MGRGIAVPPYICSKIYEMRENGASVQQIMDEYSVSRMTVYRACQPKDQPPNHAGCPQLLSSSDR